MADALDAAEGFELLFGTHPILIGGLQIAEDEFDGLGQATGGNGLPYFAKAASSQPLDELVTRNRFGLTFNPDGHGCATRTRKKGKRKKVKAYSLLLPFSTEVGCIEP